MEIDRRHGSGHTPTVDRNGNGRSNCHLNRSLTLFPATALVVGVVIGSGIFVSSAQMARDLKSPGLLLMVWALTGVMTLFGAFTLCELLGQIPSTGGLYRYLRDIYGEKTGFFYGWASFTIAGSGGIAALAFIFATYVSEFVWLPHLGPGLEKWALTIPYVGSIFPLADIGAKGVGILLIAFLTLLNIRGVKLGAFLQCVSTSAKVMAVLSIIAVAFLCSSGHSGSFSTRSNPSPVGFALIGAVIASMSSAFWAYDGWGSVSSVAGEVHEPEKTLPRAILLGTVSVIILYLLINVAYLYVLPMAGIGGAPDDRVASSFMTAAIGSKGAVLISVLVVLSTFDATNASILTSARIYFAMAEDGLFAPGADQVHLRFKTPHRALLYQGLGAGLLLLSGSFDLLASMYIFINWILYLLQGIGVFVLRRRNPTGLRPYQTPGYPWVPLAFVVFAAAFVILTLVNDVADFHSGKEPIIKSLMGVLFVMTGLPFYIYWKTRSKIPNSSLRD